MALSAHEHPLNKIFSSDFDFVIPHYQRPYAWEPEQARQLLDDLDAATERPEDEPYFLGSLVLIRPEPDKPLSMVVDGQQRLTTLSLLFAVMRDLTSTDKHRLTLGAMVMEPGEELDGIPAKPRLSLRQQDAHFFRTYVQTPGNIKELLRLSAAQLHTDSQAGLQANARVLHEALRDRSAEELMRLASQARRRTFLVVVTTPGIASAHRIFSVMNARGLDLSPADIFKSTVIGAIPEELQPEYARRWETAEQDLGRDNFADLFLHIRAIFAKVRGQRELLVEFPEQVLNRFIAQNRAAEFVDDVLIPYADAMGHLLNQDYDHDDPHWNQVNRWLQRLAMVDNNDWRPAALWALRKYDSEPQVLTAYLAKLERLAASMLIRRVYATPRARRYLEVLTQVETAPGSPAEVPALDLTDDEKSDTRNRLDGEIYLVAPVRKYTLLRLNELLAQGAGVAYEHKIITVEHVLPQAPRPDSQWVSDFSEDERDRWTHRLGNLLLLSRNRNSSAQNFDFIPKKMKYFEKSGPTSFALTTDVLNRDTWTPAVVAERHKHLLQMLVDEWELI